MTEISFNNVLSKTSFSKNHLLVPCTRETWAKEMGTSVNTLRRWESHILNPEINSGMKVLYSLGAGIKKDSSGRSHIPQLLNAYQKFIFLFLKYSLQTNFSTVPQVLLWLKENGSDFKARHSVLMPAKVNEWIDSNEADDYNYSESLDGYDVAELKEWSTREEWAQALGVTYRTLKRWEDEILVANCAYDFPGNILDGKTIDECRAEARGLDPVAAEYCYNGSDRKKLDSFQKLYLLVILKIKQSSPAWTNQAIRAYLTTKTSTGYRCDRLNRKDFQIWLSTQ